MLACAHVCTRIHTHTPWRISHGDIHQQEQSPLFTALLLPVRPPLTPFRAAQSALSTTFPGQIESSLRTNSLGLEDSLLHQAALLENPSSYSSSQSSHLWESQWNQTENFKSGQHPWLFVPEPISKLAPAKRERVVSQNLEVSGGAGFDLVVSRGSSHFSTSLSPISSQLCFFLYIVGRRSLVAPTPQPST